jgi:hypothetical protein
MSNSVNWRRNGVQMAAWLRDPHRQWWVRPLMVVLVTRLVIFSAAYLSELALPGISGVQYWHAAADNVFLDVWARWDSGFYMRIAEQGYSYVPGLQSAVAFFPVYPLLMRLLMPLTGSSLTAGWIVSNLSLFGALIFLYRLTEFETGDLAVASRTIYYIAAFPTAFFFNAVYTESTFLLLSVAVFYFARKRQWGWAALAGVLCAAARIIGVLAWGIAGLEWLAAHGWTLATCYRREAWAGVWRGVREDWRSLATLGLIPLGLLSYMGFLWRTFGDPVAFWSVQSSWGREMRGPLAMILDTLDRLFRANWMRGEANYLDIVNLLTFLIGLAVIVVIWRRLGESFAVYSLLSLLIPSASGLGSMTRYILVIFPVFMLLGLWGRRPLLDRALTIGFSTLLGVFTVIFVNWLFIA